MPALTYCHKCPKKLVDQERFYILTARGALSGPYAAEPSNDVPTGDHPVCEPCVWDKPELRLIIETSLRKDRGHILDFYRWMVREGRISDAR